MVGLWEQSERKARMDLRALLDQRARQDLPDPRERKVRSVNWAQPDQRDRRVRREAQERQEIKVRLVRWGPPDRPA